MGGRNEERALEAERGVALGEEVAYRDGSGKRR
jgi:hypothetical protein